MIKREREVEVQQQEHDSRSGRNNEIEGDFKKLQDDLNQLFADYNQRYWHAALTGWRVEVGEDQPGYYGFCDRKAKKLYIRLSAHVGSGESVETTLIHEMAHAATNQDHGTKWRNEMERVRSMGAPTTPLDFLVPYSSRRIVVDFISAARSGATWKEALCDLGDTYDLVDAARKPTGRRAATILREAKRFFDIELTRIAEKRQGRTEAVHQQEPRTDVA